MLNHPTHQQLNQLRLFGMAKALNEQQTLPELERMSFEERLGLLVEREISERASSANDCQTTPRQAETCGCAGRCRLQGGSWP